MNRTLPLCAALLLAACKPVSTQSTAATAAASAGTDRSSAQAALGEVVLKASAMPAAQINAMSAKQYGIDQHGSDVLLMIQLRDAAGNAVSTDGLQVDATVATLPDPAKPLPLRPIVANGLTDLIAVVPAKPPASLTFDITARKAGAQARMQFNQDVLPGR